MTATVQRNTANKLAYYVKLSQYNQFDDAVVVLKYEEIEDIGTLNNRVLQTALERANNYIENVLTDNTKIEKLEEEIKKAEKAKNTNQTQINKAARELNESIEKLKYKKTEIEQIITDSGEVIDDQYSDELYTNDSFENYKGSVSELSKKYNEKPDDDITQMSAKEAINAKKDLKRIELDWSKLEELKTKGTITEKEYTDSREELNKKEDLRQRDINNVIFDFVQKDKSKRTLKNLGGTIRDIEDNVQFYMNYDLAVKAFPKLLEAKDDQGRPLFILGREKRVELTYRELRQYRGTNSNLITKNFIKYGQPNAKYLSDLDIRVYDEKDDYVGNLDLHINSWETDRFVDGAMNYEITAELFTAPRAVRDPNGKGDNFTIQILYPGDEGYKAPNERNK